MTDPSKLDIAKLAKVRALMEGGATEGERAAARTRATSMAAAAAMTLDQALSELDRPATAPQQRGFLDGFEDWMEDREPGYRARRAEELAARERQRRARCAELLREYGSEEAVFAETERERLLRLKLEPLADRRKYSGEIGSDGNIRETEKTYIDGYAGWTCRRPPPALWHALNEAYPLPVTVTAAWSEHQEWERLMSDRRAFFPEGDTPVWVRARQAALSSILDRYSEPTSDGIRTRLRWMLSHIEADFRRDLEEEKETVIALMLDFEMLMMDAQHGHASEARTRRTNADKKADVLSMLDAHPELSDREIARRTGVSPQTVNTWRKKAKAQENQHAV